MKRGAAHAKKKERPPVSELAITLWVLAVLLATLLGTIWFFRMIYDPS